MLLIHKSILSYIWSTKLLTLQPPFDFLVDLSGLAFPFHTSPFPSCRQPARPTVIGSVPLPETLALASGGFSQTQTLSTQTQPLK